MSDNEIFQVKARRCKRCGGLLTSKDAIEDGYGRICKMKMRREEAERELLENQISIFGGQESERRQR